MILEINTFYKVACLFYKYLVAQSSANSGRIIAWPFLQRQNLLWGKDT